MRQSERAPWEWDAGTCAFQLRGRGFWPRSVTQSRSRPTINSVLAWLLPASSRAIRQRFLCESPEIPGRCTSKMNISPSRPPFVLFRAKETTPAMMFGVFSDAAASQVTSRGCSTASVGAGTTRRNTATALGARRGEEEEEKPTSAAAMSGVGSAGSNLLLLLSSLMVIKGLLLPENVR